MKRDLYRVQLVSKIKLCGARIGPLFDGCVVSRALLGPLVRETAINANIVMRSLDNARTIEVCSCVVALPLLRT